MIFTAGQQEHIYNNYRAQNYCLNCIDFSLLRGGSSVGASPPTPMNSMEIRGEEGEEEERRERRRRKGGDEEEEEAAPPASDSSLRHCLSVGV